MGHKTWNHKTKMPVHMENNIICVIAHAGGSRRLYDGTGTSRECSNVGSKSEHQKERRRQHKKLENDV